MLIVVLFTKVHCEQKFSCKQMLLCNVWASVSQKRPVQEPLSYLEQKARFYHKPPFFKTSFTVASKTWWGTVCNSSQVAHDPWRANPIESVLKFSSWRELPVGVSENLLSLQLVLLKYLGIRNSITQKVVGPLPNPIDSSPKLFSRLQYLQYIVLRKLCKLYVFVR